jgi:hypothetical protein
MAVFNPLTFFVPGSIGSGAPAPTVPTAPSTLPTGPIAQAPSTTSPTQPPVTRAPQSTGYDTSPSTGFVSLFQASSAPAPAPPPSTNTQPATVGSSPATGVPIDTSGGVIGSSGGDTQTSRLLDLIAAQYAAGASGGMSPDFGGLLTAPVGPATGAPDNTSDPNAPPTTSAAPASSSGHGLALAILILGIVAGVYYWRKHHKARAA